jgi:hypothetical protein
VLIGYVPAAVCATFNTGALKSVQQDGKQHLVNGVGKCLHGVGDGDTVAGNVVTTNCWEVPNQVWR